MPVLSRIGFFIFKGFGRDVVGIPSKAEKTIHVIKNKCVHLTLQKFCKKNLQFFNIRMVLIA